MNMAISRNTNGWGTKEREEKMTMPRFWLQCEKECCHFLLNIGNEAELERNMAN